MNRKVTVEVDEGGSVDNDSTTGSPIKRNNFASLNSSGEDSVMRDTMQDKTGKAVVYLNTNIENKGRRSQQKLMTKESDRKKHLEERHISAMARTQGDGDWPLDLEAVEDEEDHERSYHTLKRTVSEEEKLISGDFLVDKQFRGEGFPNNGQYLKKSGLPEQFRDTTLTGFKSKLVVKSDAPSCFCAKK